MAGPMVGPLLGRLGLDLVTTYWAPDGHFPDHEPNPLLEENRRFIVDKVREEAADLGIAWGRRRRPLLLHRRHRALRGRRLPHGDPGRAPAGETARRSDPLRRPRVLGGSAHGRGRGRPRFANRVGHAFFKTRMRDEGAIFGGEVSGHYYFHDFFNADSGTIPALLVLEKLSVEGVRMSELVDRYRSRYFISGEINSEVADQAGRMAEIEERHAPRARGSRTSTA
jgi:phosphomannomutase